MSHTDAPDKAEAVTPVFIWRCRNPDCKAWIREEMADADHPDCPLCGGETIRSVRMLPKLRNKSKRPAPASVPLH